MMARWSPQRSAGTFSIPPGTQAGLRIDALDHMRVAQEQLNIIKVGFQCDLIRTATFSYAHGNSDVQFANLLPNFGVMTGHHDISHLTDADSVRRLADIDQWYCQRLADFLTDLKNTPESDGTSMLDNTLVVFISDVSLGAGHLWERMPVTFHGGKALGLQGGRNLKMNKRFMNDIWASVLAAYGVPLPADNKFAGNTNWPTLQSPASAPRMGQGAVVGIFA